MRHPTHPGQGQLPEDLNPEPSLERGAYTSLAERQGGGSIPGTAASRCKDAEEDTWRALQVNEDEAVMEETGQVGTNQTMQGLGCQTNRFGQMHKGIRSTNGTHRERQ